MLLCSVEHTDKLMVSSGAIEGAIMLGIFLRRSLVARFAAHVITDGICARANAALWGSGCVCRHMHYVPCTFAALYDVDAVLQFLLLPLRFSLSRNWREIGSFLHWLSLADQSASVAEADSSSSPCTGDGGECHSLSPKCQLIKESMPDLD